MFRRFRKNFINRHIVPQAAPPFCIIKGVAFYHADKTIYEARPHFLYRVS
jgi:hypothetical protein